MNKELSHCDHTTQELSLPLKYLKNLEIKNNSKDILNKEEVSQILVL